MNAGTDRDIGWRALDRLGRALGFVAGGAALVLLWAFALTNGARGRAWSPAARQDGKLP